jgi:hypothetical protein
MLQCNVQSSIAGVSVVQESKTRFGRFVSPKSYLGLQTCEIKQICPLAFFVSFVLFVDNHYFAKLINCR